jgi:uncharacterized protein DUF2164
MRHKLPIEIPTASRAKAIASIRRYFREELDQDIGDLKIEFPFWERNSQTDPSQAATKRGRK